MIVWPARAWSTTVSQAPRRGRRSGWRRSSTGVGTAMMIASAAARSAGSAVSASVPSSRWRASWSCSWSRSSASPAAMAARRRAEMSSPMTGWPATPSAIAVGRHVAHADDGDAEVGGGRPGVGACQLGGGGNWVHGVWDGGVGSGASAGSPRRAAGAAGARSRARLAGDARSARCVWVGAAGPVGGRARRRSGSRGSLPGRSCTGARSGFQSVQPDRVKRVTGRPGRAARRAASQSAVGHSRRRAA